MSYCLNCLTPNNPDDAKFCLTCGERLLLQEFVVKVGWRGKARGLFAGWTWKNYDNMIFMLGAPEGHLPVLMAAGTGGGVAIEEEARVLFSVFNAPGVLKDFFAHVERCKLKR
jgi:hypothetical protein